MTHPVLCPQDKFLAAPTGVQYLSIVFREADQINLHLRPENNTIRRLTRTQILFRYASTIPWYRSPPRWLCEQIGCRGPRLVDGDGCPLMAPAMTNGSSRWSGGRSVVWSRPASRDNLPGGFTDRTRLIQSWLVCTFGGLHGSACARSTAAVDVGQILNSCRRPSLFAAEN